MKNNEIVASRDFYRDTRLINKKQDSNHQQRESEMVLVGKKLHQKKRKGGRPTQFETQLELAKISWAPVLECLSLLDSGEYHSIEELPIPKSEYKIDLGEKIIEIERKRPHKIKRWLTGEQIKRIHDDLINTFGGDIRIADESQLDALIDRAKHSEIFGFDPLETIVHKAAFLMHSLLRYHQFVDGQKRNGVSTAFIFLGLNGYTLWSRNVLEEVKYCIEITQDKHDIDDISNWPSNNIFNAKYLTGTTEAINSVIKSGKLPHIQCTNSHCRGYISPKSYRTRCAKCGCQYELTITNVIVTQSPTRPYVTFNIGLHRLEDSELVTSGVITLDQFDKKR